MATDRLSPLDASFLAVEGPNAPMHVGWVAAFDPPADGTRPTFDGLATHIAGRLGTPRAIASGSPRSRCRCTSPSGSTTPTSSQAHTLPPPAPAPRPARRRGALDARLARDRPLWEMWLATDLPDGRIAMVGKAHHCMVDGIAALQLAGVLLDREPQPTNGFHHANGWAPVPAPSWRRLVRAVAERAGTAPRWRSRRSSSRLRGACSRSRRPPAAAPARSRTRCSAGAQLALQHARIFGAPARALVCPLDDLRGVRRRYGVTLNDAMLAVCAGALRRFALRRGEEPGR